MTDHGTGPPVSRSFVTLCIIMPFFVLFICHYIYRFNQRTLYSTSIMQYLLEYKMKRFVNCNILDNFGSEVKLSHVGCVLAFECVY